MNTNRFRSLSLLFMFCSLVSLGFAFENMEGSAGSGREMFPEFAGFQGQKFFRGEEQLRLHVPKSFEGRSGEEYRQFYGAEVFEFVRVERILGRDTLRGKSTVFDFDYTKDKLDLQLYRSSEKRPGKNACMECHGGDYPRLTVVAGGETLTIDPKPAMRGGIRFRVADVLQESSHINVNYWLRHRIMVRADVRSGVINQGGYTFKARAFKLGIGAMYGNRFAWAGDAIVSKTEGFGRKSALVGNAHYRLAKGLKLTIGAGAFLQGSMNFGAPLSEMNTTALALEKEDSSLLPDLFRRLKTEAYGYVNTAITYEYAF